MKQYQASEDLENSWAPLLAWLDEPSGRAAVAPSAPAARAKNLLA